MLFLLATVSVAESLERSEQLYGGDEEAIPSHATMTKNKATSFVFLFLTHMRRVRIDKWQNGL